MLIVVTAAPTVVTVAAAVTVVSIVVTMPAVVTVPATVFSWYLQLGTRCTPTSSTSTKSLANEFFQALLDLQQQPTSSFRAT